MLNKKGVALNLEYTEVTTASSYGFLGCWHLIYVRSDNSIAISTTWMLLRISLLKIMVKDGFKFAMGEQSEAML